MNDAPAPAQPTSPEQLFAFLDKLGIEVTTHSHEPVFTVDEAKALRGQLPGAHCKSLFLRNKKGRYWLVVCEESTPVDLRALGDLLGSGRLSFASADRLMSVLGVIPGSVTPFALINDREHVVTVVLDQTMMAATPLNYHPLVNTMTTAIARDDLVKFVEACGHAPHIIDLGG